MNESTEPNRQGTDLIKEYLRSVDALETANSRVTNCQCDKSNAKNNLVKWLKPKEAKKDETYLMWYGEQLVKLKVGESDDEITIHKGR